MQSPEHRRGRAGSAQSVPSEPSVYQRLRSRLADPALAADVKVASPRVAISFHGVNGEVVDRFICFESDVGTLVAQIDRDGLQPPTELSQLAARHWGGRPRSMARQRVQRAPGR